MKADGGPAFPQPLFENPNGGITSPWDGFGIGGMTLRDYFATHAPLDIPSWFEHVPPAKDVPPMPDHTTLDAAHQQIAISWQKDPCFDLPEEIKWFGDKVKAHRDAKAAWSDANYAARTFQWRYAFADGMLAERSKP